MKLNNFRTALLPAAVAAAIAFAGCSRDDSMSGMVTAHLAGRVVERPPVGQFNEADVIFAQMMIRIMNRRWT